MVAIEIEFYKQLNNTPAVSLVIEAMAEMRREKLINECLPVAWDDSAYVAFANENPVGLLTYRDLAWVKRVSVVIGWVDPRCRRNGIYRTLWNRFVSDMENREDLIEIVGTTHVRNVTLRKFAAAVGRDEESINLVYRLRRPVTRASQAELESRPEQRGEESSGRLVPRQVELDTQDIPSQLSTLDPAPSHAPLWEKRMPLAQELARRTRGTPEYQEACKALWATLDGLHRGVIHRAIYSAVALIAPDKQSMARLLAELGLVAPSSLVSGGFTITMHGLDVYRYGGGHLTAGNT